MSTPARLVACHSAAPSACFVTFGPACVQGRRAPSGPSTTSAMAAARSSRGGPAAEVTSGVKRLVIERGKPEASSSTDRPRTESVRPFATTGV